MPKQKDSVTIQIGSAFWLLLETKIPALCKYGRNWAIEALIANACGLPAPRTPRQRMVDGGKKSPPIKAG